MRLQASKKPESAFCSGLKERKASGFRLHGNDFRAPNTPTTSFLPFGSKLLAGLKVFNIAVERSSSETLGQLVGTTGFSWAKVYNKSGRARPWALTLTERVPEAFEILPSAKRNSRATLM